METEQRKKTLEKNTILNLANIRSRKISGKTLITTDTGTWAALDNQTYEKILIGKADPDTQKILENKGIIITEKNIENIIKDMKKRNDFLFRGTSLHIILPTLRCNQKCIYCHSAVKAKAAKEFDMSIETAKKTLDFIFQSPSKNITIEFQGGETLLNEEIFKFIYLEANKINKTHKKEIRFALVTNLTSMTEEYFEWIIKQKIDITTSLDGPKEIHDKQRNLEGGQGTYDTVIKWIKRFKEHGKNIGVLQVTTKNSLKHPKEIVDEYVSLGITSIQIKPINKLGFASGPGWEDLSYEASEFTDFWKKSLDHIIELNKKGVKIKERYTKIILKKILTNQDPSFLDLRSPCGIVIGQLAYNHNGDIYSCDEGRNFEIFNLGNVHTHTYKEILSSEKTKNLVSLSINDNLTCDNCAYKPYCGVCIVCNYAATGNLIPKTGTQEDQKCQIHSYMFDYIFEKIINDFETRNIFLDWIKN
jgi:His-Xaa-Ser system radical SAM maturase HxsB